MPSLIDGDSTPCDCVACFNGAVDTDRRRPQLVVASRPGPLVCFNGAVDQTSTETVRIVARRRAPSSPASMGPSTY